MKIRPTILLAAFAAAATARALAFDVTGQVIGISRNTAPEWLMLAGDALPNNFNAEPDAIRDCRIGDVVRACGYITTNDNSKIDCIATNIVRVGRRPLPEAVEIDGGQIDDDELFHRCVKVRGVISSVIRDDTNAAWNQLTLRTPSGKICAVVQDDILGIDELTPLIDAEVRLSGYVTDFGAMLHFLGKEIGILGKDGVEVLKPANKDPFAAPKLENPPLSSRKNLHRQRVEGRVLAADRHRFYIAAKRFPFLPVLAARGAAVPPVGSRVTVVGYADRDMQNYQLTDAISRVETEPAAPETEATDIDPERLFVGSQGLAQVNDAFYGKPVRLRGRVFDAPEVIRHGLRLQVECGSRTIGVDVSRLGNGFDPAALAGCEVAVAGYCIARFERDATSYWIPRFVGWSLVPRTAADVTVLSRPPWWTTAKLLCVIGALLALIAAILIWNHALRVASERRGAHLARERIEHAKTELKAQERTRLAVELHDSISQTLTGVALQIDSAATANAGANATVERLLSISSQMLASCRKELQCCLWDLRSRTFEEQDINKAILRAVAPHAGTAKVTVALDVPRRRLTETTVQAIVRIVRELVSNAVRHGGATEISVEGGCDGGTIRMSVRDNGRGFDPRSAPGPREGHFGLRGIRERLAAFGGSLQTESAPGAGARFSMTLRTDKGAPEPSTVGKDG